MKIPVQPGLAEPDAALRIATAQQQCALDRHRLLLWIQGDAASCAEATRIILRSVPGQGKAGELVRCCWVGGIPSGDGKAAHSSAADVKNESALRMNSQLEAAPSVEMISSERDAQRLLGGETRTVVFNAHAGFDPNLFAACAGTLAGGGILLLLTPAASEWPTATSGEDYLSRMRPGLGAFSAAAPSYSHFIARAANLLGDAALRRELLAVAANDIREDDFAGCMAGPVPSPAVLTVSPDAQTAAPHEGRAAGASIGSALQPSDGQQALIAAALELSAVLRGSVLLTAERGRGKTTALGFALQRILSATAGAARWPRHVLLVAPNRRNIEPLYEVLHALAFPRGDARVRYCPPDIALLGEHDAGVAAGDTLLVIDEAAALALPVLRALCARYPRQLIATTSGGYEGSGSGFALRFANGFAQSCEAGEYRRHLQLDQPMRWACDDPLERITARLLCMQSAASVPPQMFAPVTTIAEAPGVTEVPRSRSASLIADPVASPRATIAVRSFSARELVQHDALLQEAFTLLTEAHYQTEPRDLRLLLDAPYTRLWLALRGTEVAGALLAIEEGGIAEGCELVPDVLAGRRRPRGNLAAQRLAALTGESQWLHVRSLRIVRIAVAAPLRRRGIATLLHSEVREQVRATHGYLSSSFGFSADLCRYWQAQHAVPLHIGMRLDKASGARSLLVAEALSDAVLAPLQRATTALATDLDFLLPRFFPEMSDADKHALQAYCALHASGTSASTSVRQRQPQQHQKQEQQHQQQKRLARFCAGELDLANALPAIADALRENCLLLAAQDRQRLEHCVALAPDWAALVRALDCSGKREMHSAIREICAVLAGFSQ